MKLLGSRDALLASGMSWVEDFPLGAVRLIGVAELLGAAGVILPLLLNILPILSPIAAVALTVLMLGAIAVHVRRREPFIAALITALLTVSSALLGFFVVLG